MRLLDERFLGIVILVVLALLVLVKRRATGSTVDWPMGDPLSKGVNTFNLVFLLVVSPLAAVLLVARKAVVLDPTRVAIHSPVLADVIAAAGLLIYVAGYALMAWALVVLGRQYQPGGTAPHRGDRIVIEGPYRFVRHPMYTGALVGALGLSLMTQSWAMLCAFGLYVVLIVALIRREEDRLRGAFGDPYGAYQGRVRALVPFVY